LTHAVDAYEVSLRERNLAGSTVERQRRHLDMLLQLDTNGHRPLRWLTAKRADELYAAARETTEVATHRSSLGAGKRFGAWCAKRGWLAADPFAEVEGIGRPNKGKPQLHVDESRALIDACVAEGSRASIAVATAFLLGVRASEVTDRTVRDLDDGGRLLWIDRGKTNAAQRYLEVPDVIREYLLAFKKGRPAAAYLFGKSDLDRPSRFWLHWHCKRLCRAAKVPVVPPHGLRGTHATLAKQAGATSHLVAAQLGHASTAITEQVYIAPGEVDRAAQRAALKKLRGGRA
jgi:integrase